MASKRGTARRRNVRLYDAAGNRIEFRRPFGFACDEDEEPDAEPCEAQGIEHEPCCEIECREKRSSGGLNGF